MVKFEKIIAKLLEGFFFDFSAQKMASSLHHTAQPFTFAAFPPWRIQQELVV